MKTVNDFKIIDNVATLEGIAYAEETKVVEEFLKNNINIKYASVFTKDNRYFELVSGKLLFTKEKMFINPYYNDNEEIEKQTTLQKGNLENRITCMEDKISNLENIMKKHKQIIIIMKDLLNSVDKNI